MGCGASEPAAKTAHLPHHKVDEMHKGPPGPKHGHSSDDLAEVVVECEFDGRWCELSSQEQDQICKWLMEGKVKFVITAHGIKSLIDFSDSNESFMVNVKTGTRRRIRILEADEAHKANATPVHVVDYALQAEYGAQSRRGGATLHTFRVLDGNDHAKGCFNQMLKNESRMAAQWAVFYHSYSFAALIYEVQAAVASVLFRFRSQYSSLPRILVHEFEACPDSKKLISDFCRIYADDKRDHHPDYRRVALSVMCSLASTGPEACTAMVFVAGYSCKDVMFRKVLENLLVSCYVPEKDVMKLADVIISLSEKHGLDVSQFGGKPCASGQAGHLLQIFMKRDIIDKLCYAAAPYGPVDEDRMPLSRWMDSDCSKQVGQARIVAHPEYFMQAKYVRMFVASADPTFHAKRGKFQEELVKYLDSILNKPKMRLKAAAGIYGGPNKLPEWWTAEDQRGHAAATDAPHTNAIQAKK